MKSRIESKVAPFLIKNNISDNQASLYQKFVREYFDFLATLNKSGMKSVTDKYQRTGLKTNILFGLKKIINNILRAEIKRISAQKPLPSEKQQKMAVGFTKYRIIIEKIEAETHKLLCEMSTPSPWFALYKGFSRECYKEIKKYYGRAPDKLNAALKDITTHWQKQSLKQEVLLKIKDKIISTFIEMRTKQLV